MPRAPHQRVGVALVDLIERRRAAGDERGADDRLRHRQRDPVGAGRAEVVAGGAGGDDEQVEPRLGQRDVVADRRCGASPAQRTASDAGAGVLHARAPSARIAAALRTDRGISAGDRGRDRVRLRSAQHRTRQLRSVITSEVVSTSAPQTTCRLLIQTSRRAQHGQRAERDLHGDERDDAAPPGAAARGGRGGDDQTCADSREDGERHDAARRRGGRSGPRSSRSQWSGIRWPNISGKSGIARPAPVCRIVAPTRICA